MRFLLARRERDMETLRELFNRRAYPKDIEKSVSGILDEVRLKGDSALAKFAGKFDGVRMGPRDFRIDEAEFKAAGKITSPALKKHIRLAAKNVEEFAKKQIPRGWTFSPRKGVTLGEKFSPMDRVGVYIPGGAAPLVSTAIHCAALAKIAGVKEIVAVTPPSRGGVNPAVLYAMKVAGVTEAYRLGGVYAIGALAYGTETVRKVEKIVGPGNAYVTAAKKLVYGTVGIDMAAGPSEIMVIADSSANPELVAADLLSQAEHGSGHEQAVLLSTDETLAKAVMGKLAAFSAKLKRSKALLNVIENGIFIVLVEDIATAAKIAGEYAPEHLEIQCKDARRIASKVAAAGAIFIGQWTPECAGDYVAGPSHVLPTGGTAKFFSGLSAEHFFRRSSLIEYSREAIARESSAIADIARTEGLEAHRLSVKIRCGK